LFSRPFTSLLPFSGHAPAPQCPSWSEGPRTEHGTRGASPQCRVQWHDHLPAPAGHTTPDPSQDAVGLLGPLGTLLAHVQHPKILFLQAAFQPLLLRPAALLRLL